MDTSSPSKWRHFEAGIILLCYLRGSGTNKQEVVDSEGQAVFKTRSLQW
jgi:hypothetical protein